MTRLSGWCSGHDGCTSPRAHATCGERIARGLLDGCGCRAWGGHESSTVERESGSRVPESVGGMWDNGSTTKRPPDGARTPFNPGALPTNEESTSA